MNRLAYLLTKLIYRLSDWFRTSEMFKDIWYSLRNRDQFTELWDHEEMLADKQRNDSYHAAIAKYVKRGDTVIDIGAGTGLLSFFAAQQSPARIYAIDHSNLIKSAEMAAKHNKFDNVEFVFTHSQQLKLDRKVDVIIHEQLGSFLFDENMVTNVLDVRDRLLKKGGKILPAKFELFIEPVKLMDSRRVPFIWEQNIHGVDFSYCKNDGSRPGKYNLLWSRDTSYIDFFLCQPHAIYQCDLHTMNEKDLPKQLGYSRTIENSGRLDGFVVYFNGYFDDDIFFTSHPLEYRSNNWAFRILRVETSYFEKGDSIQFNLNIRSWINPETWQWRYFKNNLL